MAKIIILSETRAKLVGASSKILQAVDEALSWEDPNRNYVPAFKAGFWDGRRRLFKRASGLFPLGCLKRVLETAPGTVVEDMRPPRQIPQPSPIREDMLEDVVLRDYQIDAVRAALKARRGTLKLATGAGKTLCAAALIRSFPNTTSVLYVVHTKVLARQARSDLAGHLGIVEDAIGMIGNGLWLPKRITIAIVNSLFKNLKNRDRAVWIASNDVFITDEHHHYRAATFFPVAQACGASWRFGLSATPFEHEGERLMIEAAAGPIVSTITSDELIKRGFLAEPTVEIVSYSSKRLESEWEWQQIYKAGVIENPERNAALVERVRAAGDKLVLILVSQIWHGDIISTMLRSIGIAHAFVHGKMPDEAVDAGKTRFEAREVSVLIASPIFGEGVNCPAIEVLVIADGGRSLKSTLQKVGRALRKKEGRNVVTIVDFADTAHKKLAQHSERRISIYQKEKFEVVAV